MVPATARGPVADGPRAPPPLRSRADRFDVVEVDLVPPNPASPAFHTGRGYAEVGRLGDEEHLVVLMTKDLSGPAGRGRATG